jgi:hypothetical protein
VRDEEAIAVDQRGIGVKGVGFAVEPVTPRLESVDLVPDGDLVIERPLEAAAQL